MIDYSDYLKSIYAGQKVQKISVDAGFSCPNRDGTIGTGGCIYCRNDSFTPDYCRIHKGIREQIEEGKRFFSKKYPEMKYLAYFQSYTNTYGRSAESLRRLYEESLLCDDIVGLVIGTRPDTLSDEVLEVLSEINRTHPVIIEIGAETSSDYTLSFINRHHTWSDVKDVCHRISAKGLHCGLHLIAGLPGEDDMQVLKNIRHACDLPIETIKLHQLQILDGTILAEKWKEGEIEVTPYTLDSYLDLCLKILDIVPDNIIIERFLSQSPPQLVLAPKWGIKNYQFTHLLNNKRKEQVKNL